MKAEKHLLETYLKLLLYCISKRIQYDRAFDHHLISVVLFSVLLFISVVLVISLVLFIAVMVLSMLFIASAFVVTSALASVVTAALASVVSPSLREAADAVLQRRLFGMDSYEADDLILLVVILASLIAESGDTASLAGSSVENGGAVAFANIAAVAAHMVRHVNGALELVAVTPVAVEVAAFMFFAAAAAAAIVFAATVLVVTILAATVLAVTILATTVSAVTMIFMIAVLSVFLVFFVVFIFLFLPASGQSRRVFDSIGFDFRIVGSRRQRQRHHAQ